MYVFIWTNIVILWTTSVFLTDACPVDSYFLSDYSACYWVTSSANNEEESRRLCQMNRGALAIIPNQIINEDIRTFNLSRQKLWIGVNDKDNEGVFRNSDGSSVSWTNWYDGQPSDPGLSAFHAQDCVSIDSDGKWFDTDCGKYYHALCFRDGKNDAFTQGGSQRLTVTVSKNEEKTTSTVSRNNDTDASVQDGSQRLNVTACKNEEKSASTVSRNNAYLIIPAGVVGIVIGSVVTIVIIIVWKRCRPSKKQIQDPRYASLEISRDTLGYASLEINRNTLGPQYDVIGTANPVTSGTETQARSSEHSYISVYP